MLISKEFWPRLQGPELVSEIRRKVRRYFDVADELGCITRWREHYNTYFMCKGEQTNASSKLQLGSRKKPEVVIQVPEMRSLVRQQLAFMLAEGIGFQCVSSVGDTRSVMGSEIGEKIGNYLYTERIKPSLIDCAENLVVYGATGSHLRWDEQKGDTVMEPYQTEMRDPQTGAVVPETSKDDNGQERVDPQTGQPIPLTDDNGQVVPKLMSATRPGKSGAPYREALDPTMFAYDPIMGEKANWNVAFERTNLHVLAAKYGAQDPKLAELILNQSTNDEYEAYRYSSYLMQYGLDEGDIIAMHWYYADSVEVPGGRHVLVLGDDCIDLGRNPLPSGRMPLRILLNSKMTDNALSFADSAGIIPIEEALNKLRSSELNNFAYYGKQTRYREETTRVVPGEQLSGGTRELVGARGSSIPQMLQINPMPTNSKLLKEDLIEALPRTSGFGDVSRGTVEDTTSGAHAAVFEAITARNLSLPTQQIVTLETDVMNDTIEFTRNFANVEFVVEVAGKGGSPLARAFAPEDLGTLRRFIAKAVPDAMRGSLARIKLVELTKDIPDPREQAKAIQFILRGDDEYGRNDSRCQNLISIENERLLSGEDMDSVAVAAEDNHYAHNVDHKAALDEYRTIPNPDPQVIVRFQTHMNEHTAQLQNQDPVMCKTLGYPDPPILPGNNAFIFAQRMQEAQMMLAPPPSPDENNDNEGAEQAEAPEEQSEQQR